MPKNIKLKWKKNNENDLHQNHLNSRKLINPVQTNCMLYSGMLWYSLKIKKPITGYDIFFAVAWKNNAMFWDFKPTL